MPRTETILTVFVASPKDVKEERKCLEEVIRELNITWSKTLGIRLDLVKWETHAFPSFGEDAQAVINDQICSEFDIFIGVMWTRYGTPTNRAESGTIEEFNKAYDKHKEDPNSIILMVYFKDEPVPPSKLNPEELAKIAEFKEKLGSLGGLFWNFQDTDNFTSLVRIHLSKVVQEYLSKLKRTPGSITEDKSARENGESEYNLAEEQIIEDEPGYIDLIEEVQDSFEKLQDVTIKMTGSLNKLTENINDRTSELNDAAKLPDSSIKIKTVKRIAKKTANNMEAYVLRTKVEIPFFAESLQSGLDAFGKVASISVDFIGEEANKLEEALGIVSTLCKSMSETLKSIVGFRTVIESLPRITTKFNRARKETILILDQLINEFEKGDNLAEEIEKSIQVTLSNLSQE